MHFRLFVLIDKNQAKSSQEARDYVFSTLEGEGFTTQGKFSYGPADWYVIGGRWSGELTRLGLDQKKLEAFNAEFDKEQLGYINNDDKKEELQKMKTQLLWNKHFPDWEGDMPVWRNQYNNDGYEDDAMIVTKELWSTIMSPDYWKNNWNVKEAPKEFSVEAGIIDLGEDSCDGETIPEAKEIVGKKWIVVVDYHN